MSSVKQQTRFSWKKLPKPITVLAPMEDVTDTVFRQIVGKCAKPDVYFTEFTSVDGLFSKGREEVITRFRFTQKERPIIAQVWGTDPPLFFKAARLIVSLGFDGMDINTGCPEKNVTRHGAGAKLIDEPKKVHEIIQASKEGLEGRIPLSVKTRLGFKSMNPDWIPFLLQEHLDAIIIHGRTAKEMSKVPAHWDEIAKATGKGTIIIGNGDIVNYSDAKDKCRKFGVDGVMIGRGIFYDLWAFDKQGFSMMEDHARLRDLMKQHVELFKKTWGTKRNFAALKKFFKIYLQGFPDASHIRDQFMKAKNAEEVLSLLASTF